MVNNQPVTYRHFGGDKLRTAKKQFGGVVKAGLIPRYPPRGLHLTFYTPGIKLVTGHFALCPVHLRLSHFAYVC